MASGPFTKHRREAADFSIDFSPEIASGDGLDSSTTVTIDVTRKTAVGVKDKSTHFGITSKTVSGTTVKFRLGAASSGDQPAGRYELFVSVDTTGGDTLIDTPFLEISEEADLNAP